MQINESEWKSIQEYIQSQFNVKPDIHNILFLIGVQELGYGFQQLDQATKTKVINFASIYILNYVEKENKQIFKNQGDEENYYNEDIYKTGIINYFKSKKIL
ncbi:MAG: hypothetical protein K9H65_01285 [Bacteroidales bacterium]|nr:hypothetical protein [Bacteroidales bacterium]